MYEKEVNSVLEYVKNNLVIEDFTYSIRKKPKEIIVKVFPYDNLPFYLGYIIDKKELTIVFSLYYSKLPSKEDKEEYLRDIANLERFFPSLYNSLPEYNNLKETYKNIIGITNLKPFSK